MSTATMNNSTATTAIKNPWKQTATSSGGGGGEYRLCPAGPKIARIVGMFHIGRIDKFGKDQDTIILVFETLKKGDDGKSFILAEEYHFSPNIKSNWRQMIESLLSQSFSDGQEYDVSELLGMFVRVDIKHSPNADGTKTYHNVGGVQALGEEDAIPPADKFQCPLVLWSVLGGERFPEQHNGWLPFVYGQAIQVKAGGSNEAKAARGEVVGPPPAPAAETEEDNPF